MRIRTAFDSHRIGTWSEPGNSGCRTDGEFPGQLNDYHLLHGVS
jgi:hypothetical protein